MSLNTQTFQSLFDEIKPNVAGHLWNKYSPEYDQSICPEDIVFSGLAGKLKFSSQKIKENHFFITKSNLLYYKKSNTYNKIKGIFDINYSRVEYIPLKEDNKHMPKYSYIIRLIKNLKFTDLYIRTKTELLNWEAFLNQRIIQSNFHKKYSPIREIGEGGFAKVTFD